jgi:pyruvate kinase
VRRTKIVATIGPATETEERLQQLLEAGLNVARLNFSHGTIEWHRERVELLRRLAAERGMPLAILQDLSGPKVRVGEIPEPGIELRPGEDCYFTARKTDPGPPPRIQLTVPELLAALTPGTSVFLDDGLMEVVVRSREGSEVRCEVISGGCLRSHKGVVASGIAVEIPSITEKDIEDLKLGLSLDVDWVAVSYVRRAADLEPVRAIIREAGADTPIIAKIEKWEAVRNLEELAAAADALMVARGDLGVEIPLPQVPVIQKEIIRRCNSAGKPVITATQMLDSMIRLPRPTRAEVSDVANAIFDGTDAVMLSGETAAGAYPVEAVRMMDEIARCAETALDYRLLLQLHVSAVAENATDAISQGCCEIAADLRAAAIVASTTSGHTARMIARGRPQMPIVGATANPRTYRRLALTWGVHPLLVAPTRDTDSMLARAVEGAAAAGIVHAGDTVVITGGIPVGTPGNTNLIKIQRV